MEDNVHYVMRSKNIIFALILSLVLASCSTSAPTIKPPKSEGEIYYVAKVDITASDKQSEIESKYGAKAIFFNREAGFAVLGFSKEAGELTSLTTTQNQDTFSSPEVSSQGFNAWSGGYNAWSGGYNAWAGGYNAWSGGYNAWSGGYNAWSGGYNAWSGGYNAWASGLPMNSTVGSNMHVWDRINLAEGQLRAPNLGQGVVVAVIDTGIDANHPGILFSRTSSLSTWKDYVDNDNDPYDVGDTNDHGHGHGTAVASLILKVAPKAKIMPLRVLDTDGNGDTDDVVSAISWAVNHGADIINLSLGTNNNDPVLSAMINWANSQGVFIVSSAGNGDTDSVTYPAAYSSATNKVFSVGSANLHNQKSDFSNYGTIDFVVPGEGLISAFPNSQTAAVSGTSFAAPVATGTIALALGQNPSSGRIYSLKSHLKTSSTNIVSENPSYVDELGGGLLNVEKFMQFMGNSAPSPARTALFVVGEVPVYSSDELIKERLELLGFSVTVVKDQFVYSGQGSNKDLVVISSTVDENYITTKFRDVAVPVITWENDLFGYMSLTYDSGDIYNQDSVKINTSHPLSMGFSKYKILKVYDASTDPDEHRLAYGKVYPAAIRVATVPSDANKAVIFAYEKGAALGTIWAPAKRVGFFFQNYDDLSISNYGIALFDAAVVWATNDRYAISSQSKTWIEAESPSSVSGGFEWDSTAPWTVSGGSFMTIPESFGDDYDGNGSPNAKVNYKLKVETSGTYKIWLRSYGANDTSDSFYVQTDGGSKEAKAFIAGDWRWVKVSRYLSAGEHTLTISLREDGAKLDKILITSDSSFTPYGLGGY